MSELRFNNEMKYFVAYKVTEADGTEKSHMATFRAEEIAIKYAKTKLRNLEYRAKKENISFSCYRGITIGNVIVNE